jgi:hypothetical protein
MILSLWKSLLFGFLLLGSWTGFSQEKQGWSEEITRLEAKHASGLLATVQLLSTELAIQHHLALKGEQTQQALALETEVALAEADLKRLKSGRMPTFYGLVADRADWLRAATGKTWALVGTTNVKRLGIRAGLLHLIDEKTRATLHASHASAHSSPGFFYQVTSQRPFLCCYFSPDLKALHYMTANSLTSSTDPISQSLPVLANDAKKETKPDPKADLSALLSNKLKKGVDAYLEALIQLLLEPAEKDETALLALQQAKIQRTALFLPRPAFSERSGQVPHDFLPLAEGRTWHFKSSTLSSISYASKAFKVIDAKGQMFIFYNIKVLWPGFLTITHPNGTKYGLWFEGETLDKLRVTLIERQWSGYLME